MAETTHIFFWKPEQEHGIYSQWWGEHPFTSGSTTYPTAEHYMMASKARLFKDEEVEKQILEATNPKDVKALGRLVHNFDEEVWKANRMRIVEEASLLKFSQHEELKKALLATGDAYLVEASPLDKIWGIGFGKEKALANRSKWGLNLLGKALMTVRTKLREEQRANTF